MVRKVGISNNPFGAEKVLNNKMFIKPALAAVTVGLVVGCAQPSQRLNSSSTNSSSQSQASECATTECEVQANNTQAQVDQWSATQASVQYDNSWNGSNDNNNRAPVAQASTSNDSRSSSSIEESTIIMGDFIMTATVRALPQPNRFFTKVVIEEVDANGDSSVIGSPQLVSSAGQKGQVSIHGEANGMSTTSDDISVLVHVPKNGDDVDVQVFIERNGALVADPVIEVSQPR